MKCQGQTSACAPLSSTVRRHCVCAASDEDLAPGDLDGHLDVGVHALVHWTRVGSFFKCLLVFAAQLVWYADLHRNLLDLPGWGISHFLVDRGGSTADVHLQSAGLERHDAQDATSQRGCYQVRG